MYVSSQLVDCRGQARLKIMNTPYTSAMMFTGQPHLPRWK